MAGTTSRLPELTGLRGAAALGVVGFHALFFASGVAGAGATGTLARIMSNGWLGVDFFFVLSAFVITRSIIARPVGAGVAFWRPYLAQRWLRIAPAYLASFVVLFAGMGLWNYWRTNPGDIALHALLLHNFSPSTFMSMNSAYWSLPVEFQIYLFLPPLALLMKRYGWARPFALAFMTGILWRFLVFQPGDSLYSYWLGNQALGFLPHAAAGAAAAFVVGGEAFASKTTLVTLALAALALVVGPQLLFPGGSGTLDMDSAMTAALLRPLAGLGFAALVLLAASSARMARALGSRPAVAVGEVSYSIYLLHIPVCVATLPYTAPLLQWGFGAFTLGLMVVSVAAAGVFYVAVERPLLRLRTWPSRRSSPTPGVSEIGRSPLPTLDSA